MKRTKTEWMIRLVALWTAGSLTGQGGILYIGTDSAGGISKGIYATDFDPETGHLEEVTLAAEYKNPGFLALSPVHSILYSTGVPRADFGKNIGSIAAFEIQPDHQLRFLKEVSSGGENACHVAVDSSGRTAAVANYSDGSYATIRLDENGIPEDLVSVVKHEGKGPNVERQERAHAHGVYFDSKNQFLWVPDLGMDKVYVSDFDSDTSVLSEDQEMSFGLASGAGPRHLTFQNGRDQIYVINELANTVSYFQVADGGGSYREVQTLSTLPKSFHEKNTTAEIEIHGNGKFLYASNRGHDSIALFHRDLETGRLTWVDAFGCGGKTPRHFKIDPSGKWLLIAHQNSGTIEVRPIDSESGNLGEAVSTIECPAPICLLFAK